MKNLTLSILLGLGLSSTVAYGQATKESCERHVKKNIASFSLCGTLATPKSLKEIVCKSKRNLWVCDVEQVIYPSTVCKMKVTLDSGCYFNTETVLVSMNDAKVWDQVPEWWKSRFKFDAKKCKKRVNNLSDKLSVCGNSDMGRPYVESCENNADANGNVKCLVNHSPWPSSDCEMEVWLDRYCFVGYKTKITKENREDM